MNRRTTILAAALLVVLSAISATAQEKPDLLTSTLIPLAVAVDLKAGSVRYRVTSGKKAATLAETAGQTLDRKSETVVEVTVRPVAPPANSTELLPVKPPAGLEKFLEAGYFVESDTAAIKDLAVKALDGEKNSVAAAKKLEKFVSDYITKKTLAIAFATAKQTAKSRAGDCTEHAVLLCGLARASGIPSRVVGGMVFADEFVGRRQVMGYHMWTEMFVAGAWRPYDAALHRRGGFGVGHIAQMTSDLSALSAEVQLSMGLMNTLGDLKVEVLEQKK